MSHIHTTPQRRRPVNLRINLALARRAYMWRHHRSIVIAPALAQEQVFWADMRKVLAGQATESMSGDPFVLRFTGRQMQLW
jgi:hypothetical protein